MPNHCANILRVTGPAADRAAFAEFAQGYGPAWDGEASSTKKVPLDLHQFIPVPDSILTGKIDLGNDTTSLPDGTKLYRAESYYSHGPSEAFNSGGYEWVMENWGTQWGCYDTSVADDGETLTYRFRTAWSPPNLQMLSAMSEKFPTLELELKYGEQGKKFYGRMTAKAGEIITDSGGKVRWFLNGRAAASWADVAESDTAIDAASGEPLDDETFDLLKCSG